MSDLMSQEGYPYTFNPSACESCQGKCCTGESGYIYVTMSEIENIAKLLKIEVKAFAAEYLFKNGYKYSIKEQIHEQSHECIFYDRVTNGCKIYEARPTQCRTFPFWDYFKTRVDELKLECPGISDV